MTRIGKVTVKIEDGAGCPPTVLQYITENGERELATFMFERVLFRGRLPLYPGGIVRFTHIEYRRAA